MKKLLTLAVSLALAACGAEGGVVQFDTAQPPIAAGGSGGSGGEIVPDATTGGAGGDTPDAHHPGGHDDASIGGSETLDAGPTGGTGGDITPDAGPTGGTGGSETPDAGPSGCQANADCNDGNSCTADVCNMTTRECESLPRCDEAIHSCREGDGGADSFVCFCDPDKAFVHPVSQVCTALPTGAACPNEGAFACVDFAEANVNGIAKCDGGHWRLLADFACGPSGAAVTSACSVDGAEDERGCFRQVTRTWTGFDSAAY